MDLLAGDLDLGEEVEFDQPLNAWTDCTVAVIRNCDVNGIAISWSDMV